MEPQFNLIPKGYSAASDSLESVWLACGRLIVDELNCFESNPPHAWTSPTENPCQSARNTMMSCIDKSRNWEAWTDLLKCREAQISAAKFKERAPTAPDPVSCHEKVATLSTYRDSLFDEIFTPQVAAWSKEMSRVKKTCYPIKLLVKACAETEGDQSIPCLELQLSYNDCVAKEIAPVEFKVYDQCRSSNPNDPCTTAKSNLKRRMDFLAVPATDSLGLHKVDYLRYGGPFKAFDSQVQPLMHLPEAQERIQRIFERYSADRR